MSCDVTWLSLTPSNPLSIGQIVNNARTGRWVDSVPFFTVYHN